MSYIDPRLQEDDSRSSGPFVKPVHPLEKGPYYQAESPAYDESPSSDQAHPGNALDPNQANADQDDSKRPRACESCRGLKVRCDQDPSNPEAPCRRCAKANRQCIYTQPSRKRQRKADTRVADLEKKLDALTAALQAQNYAQGALPAMGNPQTQSPGEQRHSISRYPEPIDCGYRARDFPTPPSVGASVSAPSPQSFEVPNKRQKIDSNHDPSLRNSSTFPGIDRKPSAPERTPAPLLPRKELYPTKFEEQVAHVRSLVDPSFHDKVFHRYVHECVPNLPAVALPTDMTAKECLETRPNMMLAIFATAGHGLLPAETTAELFAQMLDAISEIAIRQGQATLEFVQALLIVVLWIKAPEKPERSGFYLTVHMACTMAIDLGLGKRYKASRARKGFVLPASNPDPQPLRMGLQIDSDSVEARRTWLACFYCAAAASMALRRPNLIRWTGYMQECIDFLEESPEALPSDKLFCQYVRLQKICEDISIAFKMDDPTATTISISDPKVSYTLDVHEQRLKDWERHLAPNFRSNKKLMFFYDVSMLYLHEIALHVNHNVDDFQLPFTEEGLKSNSQHSEVLTQRQMASLEACLRAAHNVISTYCGFGTEAISTTPTLFYFVRCMYALVVLIKMHLAVTAPGSEVAKIIKPEDVRVVENMEMIWTLFQEMQRHPSNKPPPKAIRILGMLRDWIQQHKDGDPKDGHSGHPSAGGVNNPKNRPFGRNPHGVPSGSSKLQVLSEAATAGQDHSGTASHPPHLPHSQRQGSRAQQTQHTPPINFRDAPSLASSEGWTFDSPNPFSHAQQRNASGSQTSGRTVDTTPNATPGLGFFLQEGGQGKAGQNPLYAGDMFGSGGMGGENFDWAAGMDLDQLLDGAFRDLDPSGDLGGWFLGDGAGAYQLPAEGTALGGNGGGNGGDGGRW
ncbi:hypothetical protein K461DRAFT_257249 [Myriangium duriaei CBS 260.36]|uniref:Zn(2)-C6 fungal-type domain-containing protein n=1 Tax=Myriangium duriaei CBS 260.36 TaxID=1168546 RepID=A0A9P4J0E7_9PEZI|nr:hypothetical protein K461DRAFT_257249 [Myriangium duriaei CBS 260.36]